MKFTSHSLFVLLSLILTLITQGIPGKLFSGLNIPLYWAHSRQHTPRGVFCSRRERLTLPDRSSRVASCVWCPFHNFTYMYLLFKFCRCLFVDFYKGGVSLRVVFGPNVAKCPQPYDYLLIEYPYGTESILIWSFSVSFWVQTWVCRPLLAKKCGLFGKWPQTCKISVLAKLTSGS